jgi:hypothetical protein
MGYHGRSVKLATYIQLLPRLRKRGTIPLFPIRLNVMVLNYAQVKLCTGRGLVVGFCERGDDISAYSKVGKFL